MSRWCVMRGSGGCWRARFSPSTSLRAKRINPASFFARQSWIASSFALRATADAVVAMTLRESDSNLKQQIRVRVLAAGYTRALRFVVPQKREQGMPDARCTRGLVCKYVRRKRTRAYRFSGGNPTFPAQWLYSLLRALPGESGFVVSVVCG